MNHWRSDVSPTTVEYALWSLDRGKDWHINAEDTAFLQCIAWETVQDHEAGQ